MDKFTKDIVEQIDNDDSDRLSLEINNFFTCRENHNKAQVERAQKITAAIQAIKDIQVSDRQQQEQARKMKFMDKVSKAEQKHTDAKQARDILNKAKRDNAKQVSDTKNAQENQRAAKTKLTELANEITIVHHQTINSFFKQNLGTELKEFFEHFVGLLRNIKQANELDVMLYFNGREGTKTEDAHKSLQFKLNNIDARELDIKYVIDHEKGLEKGCGDYTVLKTWGQAFCKMAKEVLDAKKIREEESRIKSELKDAEGIVDMWEDVVLTYEDLKSKLNYDGDHNYLAKLQERQQTLDEHVQGGEVFISVAMNTFAAQNTQEHFCAAFKQCPKVEEEEEFTAALIVNDAQKSKSKGKARASRSRVFQGEDGDEDGEKE